jgi:hypothetical protein
LITTLPLGRRSTSPSSTVRTRPSLAIFPDGIRQAEKATRNVNSTFNLGTDPPFREDAKKHAFGLFEPVILWTRPPRHEETASRTDGADAAVDWFIRDAAPQDPAVAVVGYGEGALLALCAVAADPRIDAALVSGYLHEREGVWEEPI